MSAGGTSPARSPETMIRVASARLTADWRWGRDGRTETGCRPDSLSDRTRRLSGGRSGPLCRGTGERAGRAPRGPRRKRAPTTERRRRRISAASCWCERLPTECRSSRVAAPARRPSAGCAKSPSTSRNRRDPAANRARAVQNVKTERVIQQDQPPKPVLLGTTSAAALCASARFAEGRRDHGIV